MVEIISEKEEYETLWREKKLSFLQSWQWGEVKRGEWGVVRIVASGVPITILMKKFPLVKRSFGYIARGFGGESLSKAVLQEIVEFSKNEFRLTHLVVDPDVTDKSKESYFKEVGFVNTRKTIQPNQTNFIDLSREENDLWMELRAAFRRNIKKAEKFGCKVEMYTEGIEPIGRFWSVMEKVLRKKKFGEYTYGYYKKIWDEFSKEGMAKIYVVTKDGADLASYFLIFGTDTAYELYGGVLDEAKEFRPGHLLKWSTIKDARAMGLRHYDQWGVAKMLGGGESKMSDEGGKGEVEGEYDKNDELYYISIFKEGFGGTYTEYLDQQTYVFDKALYGLFNLARDAVKVKVFLRKKIKI